MSTETPFNLALDLIRPKWTLELIYQNLLGCRRFDQFQQELGIARNLLSTRLLSLTTHGILKKVPINQNGKRFEYRITEKGLSLLPMMIALHQWSDKWSVVGTENMRLIDSNTETEIAPLLPRNALDKEVDLYQIKLVPTE